MTDDQGFHFFFNEALSIAQKNFRQNWSHLLKKSVMEIFIFCAV